MAAREHKLKRVRASAQPLHSRFCTVMKLQTGAFQSVSLQADASSTNLECPRKSSLIQNGMLREANFKEMRGKTSVNRRKLSSA
mmetsp:Transcript_21124/g.49591  ORF Transcript_21124/g.49591 Transcript_21124/m.49591 type:complete len:84 (+) Transcript_21124:90-341(+)